MRTFLLLSPFLMILFSAVPSSASNEDVLSGDFLLEIDYVVHAKGFFLGTLKLSVTTKNDRYQLQLDAKAKGIARLVSNFNSVSEEEGILVERDTLPPIFQSRRYRYVEHSYKKDKIQRILFDDQGPVKWVRGKGNAEVSFLTTEPNPSWKLRSDANPHWDQKTLEGNINWVHFFWKLATDASEKKSCKGSSYTIFDAEDIISISIKDDSRKKTFNPKHGVYKSSNPLRCFYESKNISHPEKNKPFSKESSAVIWLDTIKEGEPLIPVYASFPFRKRKGSVFLYLTGYKFERRR